MIAFQNRTRVLERSVGEMGSRAITEIYRVRSFESIGRMTAERSARPTDGSVVCKNVGGGGTRMYIFNSTAQFRRNDLPIGSPYRFERRAVNVFRFARTDMFS